MDQPPPRIPISDYMKDAVGDILEDIFERSWKEIMIYEDYITDIR